MLDDLIKNMVFLVIGAFLRDMKPFTVIKIVIFEFKKKIFPKWWSLKQKEFHTRCEEILKVHGQKNRELSLKAVLAQYDPIYHTDITRMFMRF